MANSHPVSLNSSLANSDHSVSLNSSKPNYDSVIKSIPLYKAAITGNWKTAEGILIDENRDLEAHITYDGETLLHIAVETNRSHHFVNELLKLIEKKEKKHMLRIMNHCKMNVLHYAARVGNTEAARLLVKVDKLLPQIADPEGKTALELAAMYGRKETLYYLLEVTNDVRDDENGTSPYQGHHGANVLTYAIASGFCDVALYLVKSYPNLVMEQDSNSHTVLQTLAAKPDAFTSGSELGYWQRIIYSWIPVNRKKAFEIPVNRKKAFESPMAGSLQVITTQNRTKASYGFIDFIWSVLQYLAPPVKQMHDNKVKHMQAEELVDFICLSVMKMDDHEKAWTVMGAALPIAVAHGTHEIIEKCIYHYPGLVWYDVDGFHLFQAAIIHRQEKVYNLVKQMVGHKVARQEAKDGSKCNLLHFAGKIAPSYRLNKHTGAALQLQSELQWFKEVKSFVEPIHRRALNKEENTPRTVFTNEHKDLYKEAREWMQNASSSAAFVAALIVTVAFAAIFTAPGGNDPNGKSLFLDDAVFILFAISDAVALFSASTSVLMFVALLNSRFSENDFLHALPNKLFIGLISLSISIAATMVAFGSTLALVLRDKISWIAAPVTFLAIIPVFLFLSLQYPLLVELFRSVYGRGNFYQQNNA